MGYGFQVCTFWFDNQEENADLYRFLSNFDNLARVMATESSFFCFEWVYTVFWFWVRPDLIWTRSRLVLISSRLVNHMQTSVHISETQKAENKVVMRKMSDAGRITRGSLTYDEEKLRYSSKVKFSDPEGETKYDTIEETDFGIEEEEDDVFNKAADETKTNQGFQDDESVMEEMNVHSGIVDAQTNVVNAGSAGKKSYYFNGFKVEEEYGGPAISSERNSIFHFACFSFQAARLITLIIMSIEVTKESSYVGRYFRSIYVGEVYLYIQLWLWT